MTLAGCTENLSALHPAGPAAREIATLWTVMLWGAGGILVLVMVLVALAFRRAAGTPADDRVWVWGLGIAFPVIILAGLTGYGLVVGERLQPRPAPGVVSVGAEARQWMWTFRYDDLPGLATENILHIPAGRPVDVDVTSRDVIHAFWVPRLAGKLDAIPGHTNRLRIEADAPGDYAGVSAEFSGAGYRDHVFTVRAHDPAGWSAFLEGSMR